MMRDIVGDYPAGLELSVWSPYKILALGSLPALLVGAYCLCSGRLIHRLLMSIPLDCRAAEEDGGIPGINLTGEELEQFKRWVESSSEISKRDKADQLALFRDAQRDGEV